jgi:hypothetical protein
MVLYICCILMKQYTLDLYWIKYKYSTTLLKWIANGEVKTRFSFRHELAPKRTWSSTQRSPSCKYGLVGKQDLFWVRKEKSKRNPAPTPTASSLENCAPFIRLSSATRCFRHRQIRPLYDIINLARYSVLNSSFKSPDWSARNEWCTHHNSLDRSARKA